MRTGKYTSSEIYKLMSNGRKAGDLGSPALTYIQEKKFERNLGRSLDSDTKAKATTWGQLCEKFVFISELNNINPMGDVSIDHPTIENWSGSPDFTTSDTVGDIKCPFTLKSFCQLVQPLIDLQDGNKAIKAIRDTHTSGDAYYWQLVSNAILTNKNKAELVVFCPYHSQLSELRELAEGDRDYYWIWSSNDEELPYLNDIGYYQNLYKIQFDVTDEAVKELTDRVNLINELFPTTTK